MPPFPHPVQQPSSASLLEAIWLDDIDSVRRLLHEGADPDEKDDDFGNTPLIRAAYYGFMDMVSLLLDNGAGIDSQNKYGDTALAYVANSYTRNRDAVIRLLVDRGANPDIKNSAGETALDFAVKRSHPPQNINMLREAAAKNKRLAAEFARAAKEKARKAEEQRRAELAARQQRLKTIALKRPKPGPKQ